MTTGRWISQLVNCIVLTELVTSVRHGAVVPTGVQLVADSAMPYTKPSSDTAPPGVQPVAGAARPVGTVAPIAATQNPPSPATMEKPCSRTGAVTASLLSFGPQATSYA